MARYTNKDLAQALEITQDITFEGYEGAIGVIRSLVKREIKRRSRAGPKITRFDEHARLNRERVAKHREKVKLRFNE